jgi:hypothetical protein
MAFAVCVQLASAAPPKPSAFPLSRVIGQPQSAVSKVLGDPVKRHELQPPEDFAGGTQVDYPDGPTWKTLTTVFYRSKLSFIQFVFEPKPMSEEEFFTALGLSKASFAVIASRSGYVAGTQYRGTINKHLIEIVAWHPKHGDGLGFCDLVTIELVQGGAKTQ